MKYNNRVERMLNLSDLFDFDCILICCVGSMSRVKSFIVTVCIKLSRFNLDNFQLFPLEIFNDIIILKSVDSSL